MSSMFDDIVMGAHVANAFFKGAKKFGKMAADGIQKVNESEKFQNLKTDLQNRVASSETLNTVRNEMQQRLSQITAAQPSAARKYCEKCGAALDPAAKFCSNCGAAQQILPEEESPVPAEPECEEALPTVLQNDPDDVPDIFDFRPARPAGGKKSTAGRKRIFERLVNKNAEPFAGFYRKEDPDLNLDLQIYCRDGLVCFEYYDHINGKHLYQFDDYDAAGNYLYCRAWDYQFKFIYHEDGTAELDTYEVYPGLSGTYLCLD